MKLVGFINLITMNKILRLWVRKQKIHKVTCTEIGVSIVESAFLKKSKLWEVQYLRKSITLELALVLTLKQLCTTVIGSK